MLRQRHRLITALGDGRGPRDTRRARISARRLRASLDLLAAARPDVGVEAVQDDLRALTRALGAVRDLDIAAATWQRWRSEGHGLEGHAAAFERWLTKAQTRARTPRRVHVSLARLGARLEALAEEARALDDASGRRTIARRTAARVRAAEAALTACGTLHAADRLHTLRVALKKLRYLVEVAAPLLGAEGRSALAALKRAQRRLGEWHDTDAVLRLAQRAGATGRSATVRLAGAVLADALELTGRRQHARALPALAALPPVLAALRRAAILAGAPARAAAARAEGPTAAPGRLRASRARAVGDDEWR